MDLFYISDLILSKLSQWLEIFLPHLPNLAVSLILLVAFVYLARFAR